MSVECIHCCYFFTFWAHSDCCHIPPLIFLTYITIFSSMYCTLFLHLRQVVFGIKMPRPNSLTGFSRPHTAQVRVFIILASPLLRFDMDSASQSAVLALLYNGTLLLADPNIFARLVGHNHLNNLGLRAILQLITLS